MPGTATTSTTQDLDILRAFAEKSRTFIEATDRAIAAAARLERAGFAGAGLLVDDLVDARPDKIEDSIAMAIAAGGDKEAWEWVFHRISLLCTISHVEKELAREPEYLNLVSSFELKARAAGPEVVSRMDLFCDETSERHQPRPAVQAAQKEALDLVATIVASA